MPQELHFIQKYEAQLSSTSHCGDEDTFFGTQRELLSLGKYATGGLPPALEFGCRPQQACAPFSVS